MERLILITSIALLLCACGKIEPYYGEASEVVEQAGVPNYARTIGHALLRTPDNRIRFELRLEDKIPEQLKESLVFEVFFANRETVIDYNDAAVMIVLGTKTGIESVDKLISNTQAVYYKKNKPLNKIPYKLEGRKIIIEFDAKDAEWWLVTDIVVRWSPQPKSGEDILHIVSGGWSIDGTAAMRAIPSFVSLINEK